MKTKLTSLVIIAFALFTFFNANANTNELLKLYFQSSNVINLVYTAATKSNPTVTIYDSKKNVVFSERVSNNYGVARLYNIASLPEGEYIFEVTDGKSKSVQSITYKKVLSNEPKDLKVEISQSSDEGKINLICKGVDNQPVRVAIYSKINGVIYEDYIDAGSSFSRVYDLTKLKEKGVVFEVSSEDRVVSKEVSLVKTELSLSK